MSGFRSSRGTAARAVSGLSMRSGGAVLLLAALALALVPLDAGAQRDWEFYGRVFRGAVGDRTAGLPGVSVSVYGSNDASALGELIHTTETNDTGGFKLTARRGYEFYTIVQTNLPGYVSVGAQAADGDVLDHDRVAFRAPMPSEELRGIRFWDTLSRVQLPAENRPYFAQGSAAEIIAVRGGQLEAEAVSPQVMALEADEVHKIARGGDSITRMLPRSSAAWDAGPSGALAVPEKYLTRVTRESAIPSGGVTDQPVEAVAVQPIFWPTDKMRYDSDAGRFEGSLLILLDDPSQEGTRRELTAPIEVNVTGAESVEPQRILLDHTNLPPDTVRLAESSPLDSVRVSIRTTVNAQGYDASIEVMPALTIGPKRRSLQGWGMQSVELRIGIKGASPSEPIGVSLQTTLGHVEPGIASVSADEPATVELRSQGLGPAIVVASAPGFTDARGEYRYDFPFQFFGFALVGGLVGALITHLRRRQRGEKPDLRIHLLGGILWGVVVSLAYGVLGLSLLQFSVPGGQPFSEGLVFVISALGALCWIPAPKTGAAPAGAD